MAAIVGLMVTVVVCVALVPALFSVGDQAGLEPAAAPEVAEVPEVAPAPTPEFTDTGEDTGSGSGILTAIQVIAALIAVVLVLYKFTGFLGLLREGSTDKPGEKGKARLSIFGIRIK